MKNRPLLYEDALELVGQGKLQWCVMFAGAMCILCSYVAVANVSFVLPTSQCDLQLTSQGKGILISSGFIGIIVSSHLWGFLSDTLGRRYILTRCLFVDGILYICTSLVPNYWMFLLFRFFNGFSSCGGVVSAWAYIGEFYTNQCRTRAIMIASVIGATIYFILPCIAWIVIPLPIQIPLYCGVVFKSWRLFYFICGLPSLCTSFLMLMLPESPKFLLAKGDKRECIKILAYVHLKNFGKPIDESQLSNIIIGEDEKIVKTEQNDSKIKMFIDKMWIQTVPLFKKPLNKKFLILCTMQFILYFCNNGMYLWVPETVNRIAQYQNNYPGKSGTYCMAVENYRKAFVNNSTSNTMKFLNISRNNFDYKNATNKNMKVECLDLVDFTVYQYSVLLGVLSVTGLIGTILFMKILARKLVLITYLCVSISMLLFMLFLRTVDIIFYFLLIMLVCTGTSIPVVTSAVVDYFPTNLRAMAVCFTLLSGRLGTIIASQIVGSVLDINCDVILYCFVVLLVFCTLLVTYLPKSTSKKN